MNRDELSLEDELRLDKICVQFENELVAHAQPRIEEFLLRVDEPLQSELLHELLFLEMEHYKQAGQKPSRDQYAARFPRHKRTVDFVFAAELPTQIPSISKNDADLVGSTARTSFSESSVHGRFLPGTKLAGRYRIVALLGHGGMGEVYRADDLKLHQTVALKFLPEQVAADPIRLAYFHSEVRLSRDVSHPHVCRVYDIGEVDGEHFLSMEYIDGEDLRILFRRIGQLPRDKAVQIAQQICAGLAAAHDRGVLHRDLKPANIMIDGRGHVRITDFGLARLAKSKNSQEELVGTPAYMAPEQLAGGQTSRASDIYALGLLLYEIFTGKRAHPAETIDQLRQYHEESNIQRPSSLVDNLDASIDKIIMQCLDDNPARRPLSVRAVSAALPGGDPLAAALAAGETPSPELVAAGGGHGSLRPALAVLYFASLLIGLCGIILLGNATNLMGRVQLQQPTILIDRAQTILRDFGWYDPAAPPQDTDYGYDIDAGATSLNPPNYSDSVYFWYRQSPQHMLALRKTFFQVVTQTDPPPLIPGMAGVRLDSSGRLRELYVVPIRDETRLNSNSTQFSPDQSGQVDWRTRFSQLTGLDLSSYSESEQNDWVPPVYATRIRTWVLPESEADQDSADRIEAAFVGEQPVFLRVVAPWGGPGVFDSHFITEGFAAWFAASVWFVPLVGMAVLAWRNLRAGRGDRAGAARLAVVGLLCHGVRFVLIASHVPGWQEFHLFQAAAGAGLYEAATMWIGYLALEPFLRRLWPEAMVSWNRLLSGRVRDPIVGRDVLVGLVVGVICGLIWDVDVLTNEWLNLEGPRPVGTAPIYLFGGLTVLGQLPAVAIYALIQITMISFSVIFLRLITGNQRVAVAGAVVFWTLYLSFTGNGSHPSVSWFFNGLVFVSTLGALVRFGFLAGVAAIFGCCVIFAPLTADASAWYANLGFLYAGAVAGIGFWGFYVSLGGQSLIRDPLLAENRRG